MALKKSDLYSSLWKSCDELRGGMDASQYKDYILTLLFVKYVTDKAKSDPNSLIDVPTGGSFDDMLALKGNPEIGDKINKVIGKLAEANDLQKVIDLADFNDEEKLGKGKEMQDRLSKLVTIFNDLDFRGSRAAATPPPGHAPVRCGHESIAGIGHVQRLMRPPGVVVDPPRVDRCLGIGDRPRGRVLLEQLPLDRLMPPLDLAGRGR
jgi:hypothetical protein